LVNFIFVESLYTMTADYHGSHTADPRPQAFQKPPEEWRGVWGWAITKIP
jgi:hypothetical protein